MAETEKFKRFKEHLRNGNLEGVKENLEPEYVNRIIGYLERRPIHLACENGHLEIVNLLIERKCNIESEDYLKKRPIHLACEKGHLKIVNLLIERKCNIESEDYWKRRPIHLACEKGHLKIVNLLIENKCNIESETKSGLKPIHLAIEEDHIQIVNLLIEKKCNIESKTEERERPIHLAIEKRHVEIVNLLIEKKCNIESETKSGLKPIHLAIEKGHLEIVNLLIEKKCNIESEIKEGLKPIHFAIEKGHLKIVNLLIEKKCNIESETKEGMRPIHFACLNGYKEIVKLLIAHNCLINVRDKNGQTPLDKAKSRGHWEIIKLFLELDKITKQINDSILKNDDKSFAKFYKSDFLTGRHWLEISWKRKADKIIKYFLDRPIDVTEIGYIKTFIENHPSESTNSELWEEVLLYKSIKGHHEKGFQYICKPYIINRLKKIIPCSFLELAVENGNLFFVQEIMKKSFYDGEIWNRAKEIALHKGFQYIHNSISNREYLLKCKEKNNISILHTAVCDNDLDMLEYILREGLVDSNHNHEVLSTALSEMLSNLDKQFFISNEDKIIETVNLFVQSGCHLDKGLKGDLSLIQIITKFNNERLLLALLPQQQNLLIEIDEHLLRIALNRNFYQFCESLLNLIPKENLKSSISDVVIEEALRHDCTQLLKSLVLNANDDVQQVVLELSLYHLAKQGDKDSFECLLKIEINNPFCFCDGESLLTRLLIEERLYFCERIIKSKVNKKYINFKNEKNQTPLQVAIDTVSTESLINDLIFETDVIDNMDCEGRTALMQLFVKISDNKDEDRHSRLMNAIKAIIFKGGNIYQKTSNGKTVIEFCCTSSVRKEIETFQNNHNFTNPVREKIIEREKVVVVKKTEIERKNCGVCLDREVDSVFECGHTICEVCSDKIFRCPFCNLEPVRAKRIFFN